MYDSRLQKVTQAIESVVTQTNETEKEPISLESLIETSVRSSKRRTSNKNNKGSNKNRKRTKNKTKNQSNNKNKVIKRDKYSQTLRLCYYLNLDLNL